MKRKAARCAAKARGKAPGKTRYCVNATTLSMPPCAILE